MRSNFLTPCALSLPNSTPSATPSALRFWRLRSILLAGALLGGLSGCASLQPAQFAGTKPRFEPEKFFTGRTHSWGVFEDRTANPRQRFTTDAVGRMKGGVLWLDQTFTFEDGKKLNRQWQIRRLAGQRYEATANDVVGRGTGEAQGNSFRWEYTVALKPGNPLYNVRLKQWMYLQSDGTVLNRGTLRMFGFQVAQVSESFRKEPPPPAKARRPTTEHLSERGVPKS